MKTLSLRQAITKLGGTDVELHTCYHYQMGFFNLNGQLHYVNSGDDRMRKSDGQLNSYYRTAEHKKDWTGGQNMNFTALVNSKLDSKLTTCKVKY